MEFTLDQQHYCLYSFLPPAPSSVSVCQMERLLNQGSFGVVLFLLAPNTAIVVVEDLSDSQQAELQELLSHFESIFQTPTTLPSSRSHDHQIPLFECSNHLVQDLIVIDLCKNLKLRNVFMSYWIRGLSVLVIVHFHLLFCWFEKRTTVRGCVWIIEP